jgi:hypothetical protein
MTKLQAALVGGLLLAILVGMGIMAGLISGGADGNAVAVISAIVVGLMSPLGQAYRHLFPTTDAPKDETK